MPRPESHEVVVTDSDEGVFVEDRPEPGWRERIGAVRRAARALLSTRLEIFRAELAEKGSLFGRAVVSLSLAVAFATLALLLATALVAAVLSRLLGSPIAGIAAALVLYVALAVVAALLGWKSFSSVRPFEFPVTRGELRRDLEAVRGRSASGDEGAASAEAPAAEKASVRAGGQEGREREPRPGHPTNLEERFRAGSE